MSMNRGPGGNAQNNPGGPQANYGMSQSGGPGNPGMSAWANLGQTFNGLGSAGVSQMPMDRGYGDFGQQARPGYGGRLPDSQVSFVGNRTPISQAVTAPSPQQGLLDIRNRMLYGR
jgi:hypothetical protein